jgi:large subunit ribosomal protein L10
MKELGLSGLIKAIETPCGLVFFKDEPVGTSKILCDFRKEHEKMVLEGGVLEEKILTSKDIETMSKLPSKDVLRAQVVVALNGPIVKLALVLNQSLKKFVYCIDQIRQSKSK